MNIDKDLDHLMKAGLIEVCGKDQRGENLYELTLFGQWLYDNNLYGKYIEGNKNNKMKLRDIFDHLDGKIEK